MAARLRHIAISVPDAEVAAAFFERAFGMTRAGTARRGVFLTDGTVNLALLQFPPNHKLPGIPEGDHFYGPIHFGFWVDDFEQAAEGVEAAGAHYVSGKPDSDEHYEVKYAAPDGIVFDITHSGWAGAVKEVMPEETPSA